MSPNENDTGFRSIVAQCLANFTQVARLQRAPGKRFHFDLKLNSQILTETKLQYLVSDWFTKLQFRNVFFFFCVLVVFRIKLYQKRFSTGPSKFRYTRYLRTHLHDAGLSAASHLQRGNDRSSLGTCTEGLNMKLLARGKRARAQASERRSRVSRRGLVLTWRK